MTDLDRVRKGEDLPVDFSAIEKNLSDLWRNENDDSEEGVTKAALWNVVAHTDNDTDRNTATLTLGQASASVPQRTIVIRSAINGPSELTSWISANCHMIAGSRQVCSEEISILAGGARIHGVPSLVNGLLIPDMPVATWWLGDLPDGQDEYVQALLAPADRFVVDSVHFNAVQDLRLVSSVADGTQTIPADLNWIRLEEWRLATASVFDHPVMRQLLSRIRRVRIVYGSTSGALFGEQIEAFYYATWLSRQSRHEISLRDVSSSASAVQYQFDGVNASPAGGLLRVEIDLQGGGGVAITRNDENSAIIAQPSGVELSQPTVTRNQQRDGADLIVRQLSARQQDPIFPPVLSAAASLATTYSR